VIALSLASFHSFECSAQQFLRRKLFKHVTRDSQDEGPGVVATAPHRSDKLLN
jgi:hypothetical protein